MFGEEAILVGLVAALSLDRSKVPTESAEEVKQRLKRVMTGIEDPTNMHQVPGWQPEDAWLKQNVKPNTQGVWEPLKPDPDCIEVEAHETDKPAEADFTNEKD